MGVGAMMSGAAGGSIVTILIQAVDGYSKIFKSVNTKMLLLGAGLTALGVAGLKAGAGILKIAGEFEQTTVAFQTMMGSVEEGDKMLRELAQFAARTPFSIPGVEQSAKQLMAMGIPADDLLKTMKALGDVAAGTNVPMVRLAQNFGQVKTQTKLTGRELLDFNRMGIPLLREIAENLGVTESAVKKMVTAGEIGFGDVEQAFIDMSSEGGVFFDLMDKQSETLPGIIQNISDQFTILARVLGEDLLPPTKKVADALLSIVEVAIRHPEITKFAGAIGVLGTAFALLMGPVILFKTVMAVLGPILETAGTSLGAIIGASALLVGWFLLVIVLIGAIIYAIINWRKVLKHMGIFAMKVFGVLRAGIYEIGELFRVVAELVEQNWNALFNALIDGFEWFVKLAMKVLRPIFRGLNEMGADIDISGIDAALSKFGEMRREVKSLDTIWAESRARSKEFGVGLNEQVQTGIEKMSRWDKQLPRDIITEEDLKALKEKNKLQEEAARIDAFREKYAGLKIKSTGAMSTGESQIDYIYDPKANIVDNSFSDREIEQGIRDKQGVLINDDTPVEIILYLDNEMVARQQEIIQFNKGV